MGRESLRWGRASLVVVPMTADKRSKKARRNRRFSRLIRHGRNALRRDEGKRELKTYYTQQRGAGGLLRKRKGKKRSGL